MSHLKSLVVGTVLFVTLLIWRAWLPAGQPEVGSGSPAPMATPVASLGNGLSPRTIFASPLFIAIVWPVAFVILQITLSTLASTSAVKADGPRKFRVWYADSDGRRTETSPVDVAWLMRELNDYEVFDIEVLAPGILESFTFGVDLCIGALATDLAIIFAILSGGSSSSVFILIATTVSVLILHFIIAAIAVFVLRSWSNDEQERRRIAAVQLANILGLTAIFTSFLILGSLITR